MAEAGSSEAAATAVADKHSKPRRLKGHKDCTTSCIASRDRPRVIVTSGEDGRVCWFDMRCKDVARLVMDVSVEPVTSLCFKTGNEDMIYASSGTEIKCFDVRLATKEWKPLENYNYNKEEINKVVCNLKSSFLAAADDSGEVKIIDIRQPCLYKTLRAGHTSICNTVQFLPWRSYEVISGGLDSLLLIWDFSKGRSHKVVDFGSLEANSSNTGQCVNPAFVYAITVPEVDMLDKSDKICAVARGDGVVSVINIESEIAANRSKSSSNSRKGSQSRSKDGASSSSNVDAGQNGNRRLHLDYTLGGHTAAVSCLEFSLFGERGKFIISGGNDQLVKVWNWSSYRDSGIGDNSDILNSTINVGHKVNSLCTVPADTDNLVVCDTSKSVKVYSVT